MNTFIDTIIEYIAYNTTCSEARAQLFLVGVLVCIITISLFIVVHDDTRVVAGPGHTESEMQLLENGYIISDSGEIVRGN